MSSSKNLRPFIAPLCTVLATGAGLALIWRYQSVVHDKNMIRNQSAQSLSIEATVPESGATPDGRTMPPAEGPSR